MFAAEFAFMMIPSPQFRYAPACRGDLAGARRRLGAGAVPLLSRRRVAGAGCGGPNRGSRDDPSPATGGSGGGVPQVPVAVGAAGGWRVAGRTGLPTG